MFQNLVKVILLVIILSVSLHAQKKIEIKDLRSKFAKKSNRLKFEKELLSSIDSALSIPLNNSSSKKYRKALGDASLYFIENKIIENSLSRIFSKTDLLNDKLLFTAVQTAYTLYPKKFTNEVSSLFDITDSPSIFSATAIYLLNNGSKTKLSISSEMKSRFDKYSSDPVLKFFDIFLANNNSPAPSLSDLLKNDFQDGKTIIYSFQRKDRDYPGLLIIKAPDGRFVRNENGSFFCVPQLARSASKFPGFLKNGNTPQGIYSIQRYYYSPTKEIGPSPILLSRIPFEISAIKYYHNKIAKNRWDKEDYKNLLPDSWKDYQPIYEAYYAGKSGRRVIVAHGSADDPVFYENKVYAPLTPTKGCLSTKEVWSENGRLIESDQVKFMNAFFSTKQLYGFLVVVEIDDKKKSVTIEDLLPYLYEAENSDPSN